MRYVPSGPETHEIVAADQVEAKDAVRIQQMCRAYFDQEADWYDAYDLSVDKRRRYSAAVDTYVLGKLAGYTVDDTILSFGCGTARREEEIVGKLENAPKVIGVEHSSSMARHASERNFTIVSDMEAVTDLIPSAAAILCLSSFVHIPTRDARRDLLRSFHRILSSGGILIVDVFNVDDQHEWGPSLAQRRAEGDLEAPGDVYYRRIGSELVSYMHYFSVGEITKLLEEAGFVITELIGIGYAHQPGKLGVPLDQGCVLLSCTKR